MQAFIDDFRCQKAESILKKLYKRITGIEKISLTGADRADTPTSSTSGVDEFDAAMEIPPVPALLEGLVLQEVKVNVAVFEALCAVLEKQLKPYDDKYIDDCNDAGTNKLVTDIEWELINFYNLFSSVNLLPAMAPESVDAFLREKEEAEMNRNGNNGTFTREKRRQLKEEQDRREKASNDISVLRSLTMADVARVHRIVHGLRHHHRGQHLINGSGDSANNMWIVKPAAKSRGRGIATFMDLNKLLRYVEAGSGFR